MARVKKKTGNGVVLSDEQFHAIARALGDPRRFAILEQVAACDGMACSGLVEHEVISPATISHHMKELSEAGLIEMKRVGRGTNLSLCRPVFDAYLKRLAALQCGVKA
jgi:ArsR family transcriptional regulator